MQLITKFLYRVDASRFLHQIDLEAAEFEPSSLAFGQLRRFLISIISIKGIKAYDNLYVAVINMSNF